MIENRYALRIGKYDSVLCVFEDVSRRWNELGRGTLLLHDKVSKKGSSNTQETAKNSLWKCNWKRRVSRCKCDSCKE